MVRDVLLLLKSGIACVLMCCVFKMPLFMHLFLARDLVGGYDVFLRCGLLWYNSIVVPAGCRTAHKL